MRNKGLKCLVFIMALLLADALMFMLTLKSSTFFKPEEWSVAQKLSPQDGLILGTSHAEQGCIPNILSQELGGKWFNGGRARRNLNFNQYWSETFIQNGQKPKIVILVVTYHDWNEKSHPYMIYPLANPDSRQSVALDLMTERHLLNPRTWFLCDQYSSTVRMMLARSLSWLKNRQSELYWREDTHGGYLEAWGHMKPQVKPSDFSKYPWHMKDQNFKAFLSILQQWQAVGSRVIVIDPPEYIGSRLSHRDYEQAWEMVKTECDKLNVPCRSFSQVDDVFLTDETNFRDGGWGYPNSHLSNKGAAEFSRRLADWIKTMDSPSLKN
jgi:hypothetical protein